MKYSQTHMLTIQYSVHEICNHLPHIGCKNESEWNSSLDLSHHPPHPRSSPASPTHVNRAAPASPTPQNSGHWLQSCFSQQLHHTFDFLKRHFNQKDVIYKHPHTQIDRINNDGSTKENVQIPCKIFTARGWGGWHKTLHGSPTSHPPHPRSCVGEAGV